MGPAVARIGDRRSLAFRNSLLALAPLAASVVACSASSVDRESFSSVSSAVVAAVTPPCSARGEAVIANTGTVTLNGGSLVDSYSSGLGPYGSSKVGNSAVVQAGGLIKFLGGTLDGTTRPNSPAHLAIVPVPTGATPLPRGSQTPGNLNINTASDSITLSPGSYVVASVNVNFAGAIKISPPGPVSIFVTGTLNLGGSENAGGLPQNLQFFVNSAGTVNVNANGTLAGFIYAPTSTVNVNSVVFGSVVGSAVALNSGARVHFDQSYACAAPPPTVLTTPSSLPRPLPAPPREAGCYVGTMNGWVATQCADQQAIKQTFGVPDVDQGIISSIASGPPPKTPLVFGQVEATVLNTTTAASPTFVTEQNWLDPVRLGNQSCAPGGPESGFEKTSDQWGVQNNSNLFPCDPTGPNPNGKNFCIAQFTIQTVGNGSFTNSGGVREEGTTALCITNANAGTSSCDATASDKSYNETCVGLLGHPINPQFSVSSRVGSLATSDFANIVGSTFKNSAGVAMVGMVAQFSWSEPTTNMTTLAQELDQLPGLYAIVTEDTYGLAGGWTTVTGGFLGLGDTSMAHFQDAGTSTRILASSCPGDTAAGAPTCPSQPALQPNVTIAQNMATAEENSLTLVNNSAFVSYPNRDLAMTTFLGSTVADGSCPFAPHAYVKDNDGDNGGTPSNSGGLPFWESPDLFVLPHGAPRPSLTDISTDFVITPNLTYDLYVRVNNDGCSAVNNLKALIYLADPDLGLSQWKPVTTGYASDGIPADATVAPYSKQILGPFTWPAPAGASGHKCLLAAISSDSEPAPATPLPDAFSSNQVAQRNLEFTATGCQYNITNSTNGSTFLQLGLGVTSPNSTPPVFSLAFTDSGSNSNLPSWASLWQAQLGAAAVVTGTDSAGHATVTVTISGQSQIALAAVPLSAGDSPSVQVTITPNGALPTIDVSAILFDSAGNIIARNGGSCATTPSPVVP